jgi:Transcription factor WhiB
MPATFVDQLNAREWVAEAACVDYEDVDAFFIEGTKDAGQPEDTSVRVLKAMLLCISCPVRVACLEEALSKHPLGGRAVGTWGGTTTRERHLLRKRPIPEAVYVLEEGLADRVRARVEAVRKKHPTAQLPVGAPTRAEG